MAIELLLGLILMSLGIVMLVYQFATRNGNQKKVGRDDRSVHVGGSNTGLINTGSIGGGDEERHGGHSHWLTIIAMLVELAGIAVTLWHAFHLASK